jgi:hypothetical protein
MEKSHPRNMGICNIYVLINVASPCRWHGLMTSETLTQIEKHFEGLKVAHENLLGMV